MTVKWFINQLVLALLISCCGADLRTSLEYASARHEEYVSELKEIVAIPSISAQSRFLPDLLRAADWVRDRLVKAGLKVEIV